MHTHMHANTRHTHTHTHTQVDYALASVPSMSVFLVFNFVLKFVMRGVLRIPIVPPPLVGMFIFFGYLFFLL